MYNQYISNHTLKEAKIFALARMHRGVWKVSKYGILGHELLFLKSYKAKYM